MPARFCSGRPTASSAWLGALQAASWMRAWLDLIEHDVATLIGQRVIALGYEDLNDHEHLRHDPAMAVLAGKLASVWPAVRQPSPRDETE